MLGEAYELALSIRNASDHDSEGQSVVELHRFHS